MKIGEWTEDRPTEAGWYAVMYGDVEVDANVGFVDIREHGGELFNVTEDNFTAISEYSPGYQWAKVLIGEKPEFDANVFGDRGELLGGYCTARLPDGGYIVTHMTKAEFDKIKATSKAANGPWKTWPEEMMKKSLIKRAYKSWPQSRNAAEEKAFSRLSQAVQASHEAEGTAYTLEQQNRYMELLRAGNGIDFFIFTKSVGEEVNIALYNSFADGEKVKNKAIADGLIKEASESIQSTLASVQAAIDSGDQSTLSEIEDECTEEEWEYIYNILKPDDQSHLDQLKQAS